jgi:hypothetical protein
MFFDARAWADLYGEEPIYGGEEPQDEPPCPDCGQEPENDYDGYCEPCWWARNGCDACQFPKFQCVCKGE